jgi:hypothetical protein
MNKYFITFARHTDGPIGLRRVTVTAPHAREAWDLFESLYRPRYYTAYTFQSLPQ